MALRGLWRHENASDGWRPPVLVCVFENERTHRKPLAFSLCIVRPHSRRKGELHPLDIHRAGVIPPAMLLTRLVQKVANNKRHKTNGY